MINKLNKKNFAVDFTKSDQQNSPQSVGEQMTDTDKAKSLQEQVQSTMSQLSLSRTNNVNYDFSNFDKKDNGLNYLS